MSTKARLFGILALALVAAVGGGLYGARGFVGVDSSAVAGGCSAHGVVRCPFCDPSLLDSMGFCSGHGVPEAICTRCRDDLEEAFRARGDWCAGHGLPESQCELCNPGTLEQFRRFDPSFGKPIAVQDLTQIVLEDAPRMQRAPLAACATERSTIRFVSPAVAARAGFEMASVEQTTLRRTVTAPAELHYDATRHASLASRAAGSVLEVRRRQGDRVVAGDVLVVVDSAELGSAKSELLQTAARVALWERNDARERQLLEKGLSTERDVLDAGTRLVESRIARMAAEQKLRNLGLDGSQIDAIQAQLDVSTRLDLTAPFDGVVVDVLAVVGQPAPQSSVLVSVADTSRLWVEADVEQAQMESVAVGQPVLLTLDGLAGETYAARVTWISTEVDAHTRTTKVRAELDNARGRLRARMFGRVQIVTRDGEAAVMVPKAAVQWEGCCNVAFVQRSATEFVPRKLHLGYDTRDYLEVLSGLEAGDRVVTQGSFLLKTELKKGSIGAGCCEVDHLGK